MNNFLRFLAGALLLFSISLNASSQTCNDFHTGKFGQFENNKLRYVIERKGNRQFEKDLSSGLKMTFKVIWTSDCEYTLVVLKGAKKGKDFYKDRKLYVTILETYEDSYKFSARLQGSDFVLEGIIKKI